MAEPEWRLEPFIAHSVAIGDLAQVFSAYSVVIGYNAGSSSAPSNAVIIGDDVQGIHAQADVIQVGDRVFIGALLFGAPNPIYEFVRTRTAGAQCATSGRTAACGQLHYRTGGTDGRQRRL